MLVRLKYIYIYDFELNGSRLLFFYSLASKTLSVIAHEEITNLLNQDEIEYRQLLYLTSQLSAGALLVEESISLLINTVEQFARDTITNAHYEKKLFGFSSSFPSVPSTYGYLSICLLQTL